MRENDPTPFGITGSYDYDTGQIGDVELHNATSGNEFAKMSTDVDSIACHSSKLEDLFDAISCSNTSVGIDSILNRETFVTKSPFTVKCAPRAEENGYHPKYRGNQKNTIPLKYFPNIRLCVFQKRNLSFFLSLYVLRTENLTGPRMDRNELAVISSVLNYVRNWYDTLEHWTTVTDDHKASLARAFKSWAPFMVKSGPTQEQKGLKNRVNGLNGFAACNFPFLFMDALRLIAKEEWGTMDYRHFLMHRNKTITCLPTKEQFQLEAQCLLRDIYFSVQAVGFKDNWPRIAAEVQKENQSGPPKTEDIVNTRNLTSLTLLMNKRMVEARRLALLSFFRPITARQNTCHFYSMDVGISFTPVERNFTYVFDGFAVNRLVKDQMEVKWEDTFESIDDPDQEYTLEEDYSGYDADSREWKQDTTVSNIDELSIQGRPVESTEESSLEGNPNTQRLRGGADDDASREDSESQNEDLEEEDDDALGEGSETQNEDLEEEGLDALIAAFATRGSSETDNMELQDEGIDALIAAFDGQLIEVDQISIIEEEKTEQQELNQQPDLLEAVEDRQRPYRIQYPLFGTTGKIGNAQQQTNFIQPVYCEEVDDTGQSWDKHYVHPYIPVNGRNKITGMKTYMDSSRTMFQRWTHQATHSKLKYLGIEIAHFFKSSAQQTDNSRKMPEELKILIQNMDHIYHSFLEDFRYQDRCSVRCEYTYMGEDNELLRNFDTVVDEQLCPLSTVKQVVHSDLYHQCKLIHLQNLRPLTRLSNLTVQEINQVYNPAMKTAVVARAEAAAYFLQCGGIVQGSLHNRILKECTSLFLQVPSEYHVELTIEEQSASLLSFGVRAGLLALLSDDFLKKNPRSCLYRMDASLIANVSRNATDLIRSRDELLETLFLSDPNTNLNEIGSLSEIPFLAISEQSDEVLNNIVRKTARLIYRTYNYEWQTILKVVKNTALLELTKSQIDILAENLDGYVYNSGDDRYNRSEPGKTRGMIVRNADHLLKLMAGSNVHELSHNIDMTFRGTGDVWDLHKKKQGWNKSPTTLFVALVLQLFRKLETSISQERMESMEVNPFETRNLAAYLGEYYTSRGTEADPSVVFYTMASRQRALRIAIPVRVIPIFGNLLSLTPPTKKTRIEGSRGVNARTNRGRDEFHVLFATIGEHLSEDVGRTKVSIIDILIMRVAWFKIAQIGHDLVQTNIRTPQSFCNLIATSNIAHQDKVMLFYDQYSKFNAKWKSWRTSGIKVENILQEPLHDWGNRAGLTPSFFKLFRKAVSRKRWETYRRRLQNRDVHDGQTKITLPTIRILQERIMGDERMTHKERLEEFAQTGDITSDLFSFLVQLRHKWVKLRDDYYAEDGDFESRKEIVCQLMKLIEDHSPVAGEWNAGLLIGRVLERKSCRGKSFNQ